MESFWRLLRTYCLESTIVGLKYFYLYPDIISRCFWTINMIAVLTMSFLLTFLLYNRFDEMPTRVTIENQFEPVINLPYPAIYLCSPNQITISSMKYFNRSLVDGNLTIDLTTALPMILGFYELMNDLNPNDLNHLQNLLDANRYTIPEVLGAMPQNCNRFLKRCYLERKLYPDCAQLFKPILTTHGYCCAFNSIYTFNGKRNIVDPNFVNRTVRAIGFSNSLTVVTDYDPDDAVLGTLLSAGGVRVMYTDWTEFPADDEMSIVEPDGESFHLLRATYTYCSDEVESLPVWRNCWFDLNNSLVADSPFIEEGYRVSCSDEKEPSSLSRKCYFEHEHHLPFFRKYHNSDCDQMCYVMAVRKACGCFLSFLPNVRSDDTCRVTSIPCIIGVKKDMYIWLSAQQCECPRDCVSRRYRAELITGNFHAVPYLLKNPYDGLSLNASTSVIHFFFAKPVYMKQKQETVMSIISLVSNLGGVFGLFMGCSGISVLEILFYIYIGIRNYFRHRLEIWKQNVFGHQ